MPDLQPSLIRLDGDFAPVRRVVELLRDAGGRPGAWEANNRLSKPERWPSGLLAGYGYNRTAISGRKLYIEFWTAFGRYMVDPHEAMSYAVKSPTLAVGADSGLVDSGGLTHGSICAEIDMNAAYAFDDVHSAEFLFPIQKTKALYDQTLREFRLPVLP